MAKKLKPLKKPGIEDQHLGKNILEIAAFLAWVKAQKPHLLPLAAKELGIGRRMAYYLIKIHQQFDPLGVDPDRLIKIGWAKLAIIADRVDKANYKALLILAENYTAHELQEMIQGVEPVPGTRCVLIYLAPKDYAIFEAILIKNGAVKSGRGLIGKEPALIKALNQETS